MSRRLKDTDDAGVNDESADLKCVLCEKKGIQQLSEEIVLSNFPLDINLCRSWVKNVGIKELVHMPIRELNASMYLCQKHFHPKCFVKKRNSIFLIAEAVPTEELYYRMLPENIMADFPKEIEQSQTKSSEKTVQNEDSDTIELYKCIICKGTSQPGQSKLLSRFPVEPDLCRVWVKRVGLKELATMTPIELHKTTFLCEAHFNPSCFCITSYYKYLRLPSVPELNLPYPPLENSLMKNFSVAEEKKVLHRHRRNIDFIERKMKNNNSVCQFSKVECSDEHAGGTPEEELSDLSADSNAIEFVNAGPELNLLSEDIEFKAPVSEVYSPTSDEIDAVFLKYSERFKKLSNNQQYLFSLDLEELITRFEQKNCKSADLYNEKLKRDFQLPSEGTDQRLQKPTPSPFKITPTKSPPVVKLQRKPCNTKDRRVWSSHMDATAAKTGPILPRKVRKLKKTNTIPNSGIKLTKISPLSQPAGPRRILLDTTTGLRKPARTVKSESGSQNATRLRGKLKSITRS